MKTPTSIAVWMVLISIVLKLFVFITSNQFTDIGQVAVFGNIFFLLTGIFLGIRLFKKTQLSKETASSFIDDFKAGMKVAALYSVMMAAFVYIYYSFIDISYFDIKLAKQIEMAQEQNMNLEQIKTTGEMVLSPFFQTTITLIGFILLGSFYSSILAFLMRKFPGFGH